MKSCDDTDKGISDFPLISISLQALCNSVPATCKLFSPNRYYSRLYSSLIKRYENIGGTKAHNATNPIPLTVTNECTKK